MKRPSKRQLEAAVRRWNAANPPRTTVHYWTGVREGDPKTGQTSSEASVLGGHTAGVYVLGAGFVALTHVEAV